MTGSFFLDDDDEMEKDYLANLSDEIKSGGNNCLCWCSIRKIVATGKGSKNKIKHLQYKQEYKNENQLLLAAITAGTSFGMKVHKSVLKRYGAFDAQLEV